MNKKCSLWVAATLFFVAATSCQDDSPKYVTIKVGEEVSFGAFHQSDEISSRTHYGNIIKDENGREIIQEINWVDGDQIAVYCPEASQPKTHVNYKITPNPENATHSSVVTKVNADAAGIQWGSEKIHNFYAFYPANHLDKIEDGYIYASIPVEQKVVKWEKGRDESGNVVYVGQPNMDFAYMSAWSQADKEQMPTPDVQLKFKPLVTVLEITVNGPAKESGISELKITNININETNGNSNLALTGPFRCNLRAGSPEEDYHKCEVVPKPGIERNRVSIPCYDDATGEFITLKQGEKLKVKAFFIPNDNQTIGGRQIEVSVSPMNGANFIKKIPVGVKAHKINRVVLPELLKPGINYWMSSMNPNVYATELSIPGSKLSLLNLENSSDKAFQATSIEDQFHLGVRAFILQTGASYDNDWQGFKPEEMYLAVGEKRLEMTLGQALTSLSQCLRTAQQKGKKNEMVVVNLTFSENATYASLPWSTNGNKQECWIKTLEHMLDVYKKDNNILIYGKNLNEKITPETTLGDLGGKILIKVNLNSEDMGNYVRSENMPAMFALWSVAYPFDPQNPLTAGHPLHWGRSHGILENSTMRWLYQEQTNIGYGNSSISLEQKKQYVNEMFEASLTAYQQGNHNVWFMNDLGGALSEETTTGALNLAKQLTPEFYRTLQRRDENAGLGLIYMNFADAEKGYGEACKSPELIQTVVDNNFKFPLRIKAGNPVSVSRVVVSTGADEWDE